MTSRGPVTAVLWDFDGTLVETCVKNMRVNTRIIEEVTGRPATDFDVMRSQEIYDLAQRTAMNWRDFYRLHFGLSDEDTTRAGSRWTPYQREDTTPTPPLTGIPDALGAFDGIPQGVVSQNCRLNIDATLSEHRIRDRFQTIIGYQEVAGDRQKPAPDGVLRAIEEVTGSAPGTVVYVGDHETDLRTAQNTNRTLREREMPIPVVSVAAQYGMSDPDEAWTLIADHRASSPSDIVTLVHKLNSST